MLGFATDCSSGSLCVFFFSAVCECVFVFQCILCVLSSCFVLCLRTMCLRLPQIVFDDLHGAIWRQWKYEEGAQARELCACALCHSSDALSIVLCAVHCVTLWMIAISTCSGCIYSRRCCCNARWDCACNRMAQFETWWFCTIYLLSRQQWHSR